jgi:hypothetical protein
VDDRRGRRDVVGHRSVRRRRRGWAAVYFFGTHPGLDVASGTRLLDQIADDPRIFAVVLPGALLVALGTVVQAVGLWRSRALPRWVPILSLAIALSFIAPGSGVVGALLGIPVAVAGIAIGYYAWRRTGPRPFLR